MECHHFDAGRCRSCVWLEQPYDDQLARKQARCQAVLGSQVTWLPAVRSAETAFRNKAKMVVSGVVDQPRLGILDEMGRGVDIRDCGLHVPAIQRALPVLADFVTRAALAPYDVTARRGELKYLLVTASPDGELMVRFVCRSQEPVTRIRKHLPWLHDQLPHLVSVSVNLQPEHKAVLEGEHEIPLGDSQTLVMRLNGHDLRLRPQSFFQTNTDVAAALYRTAVAWVDGIDPTTVWDLYCGVGGFALHLAAPGRTVVGIETSEEAVVAARESAGSSGLSFEAVDATTYAECSTGDVPELVVVNPPRRGIGEPLARWLERSQVAHVLYSSCNPESLARDLEAMPSLQPVRAQLFDMFPHTSHAEVLVLLTRSDAPAIGVGTRPVEQRERDGSGLQALR